MLVADTFKSKKNRAFGRKVRLTELSRLNWLGPVIEFLLAVPHWPVRGAL